MATGEPHDPDDLSTEPTEGRGRVTAPGEQASDVDRRLRIRSVASWVFIVLSTVLVVVATTAWWVHATLLDTDRFMAVVEPAITSDAFDTQLSERLTDATTEALDLEARLEERLAAVDAYLASELIEALGLGERVVDIIGRFDLPRLADLAAPIATALDDAVADAVDALVRSDEFEVAVTGAVRRAHEAAVTVATEDLTERENVYVSDGDLVVDALPLVAEAFRFVVEEGLLDGEELQPPDLSDRPRVDRGLERFRDAVGRQVPADLGQITIMTAETYDGIQDAARLFDRLVWLVGALAVVVVAAAIWVAPRRRRAVIRLSVAVLLGLALTFVLVQRLVDTVRSGIADAGVVATVDVFLAAVNGSLFDVLAVVAWLALGAGVVAYLLGRPSWAVSLAGPLGDRDRPATDTDRFVGRHTEILAASGALAVVSVAWVTNLAFWWTSGALVAFGIALWWLYGARLRVARSTEPPEPVASPPDDW